MNRVVATAGLLLAIGRIGTVQAANDATEALQALLDGTVSVQGSFVQRQYDADDTLLGEASGTFRLLRPGYFAWEIDAPDSQLIIADPQYLWQHDRDLETVTRRPIKQSSQMSPLQILGGDVSTLDHSYTVERPSENSFSLTPKGEESAFQNLLVNFEGSDLAGLEIADNLNQRIVIIFADVDADSALSPQDFLFSPPPDADLFYYDE